MFKEIEARGDEAQKQHDDDAKKSQVGGSHGFALAATLIGVLFFFGFLFFLLRVFCFFGKLP